MRKSSNLIEKFLDGGKLFHHYYVTLGKAGTARKLAKYAETIGMVNSDGHGPSAMGAWKAAWRWASLKENQAQAYEWFQCYMQALGDYCSPEEWRTMMLKRIKSAWQYPPKQYHDFLVKNGWV